MILYVLIFLASLLIALLFYRIEFKSLMQELISSYKRSGTLVAQSNPDSSSEIDLLMQEVKTQFRTLGLLLFRFILLLSPAILLMALMYLIDIPLDELFGIIPLIISTIAFLLVYLIRKYAGRSAQ